VRKNCLETPCLSLGELKSPGKQYPRRTGTTGEIFSSIGNKSPVKRAKINTFYGGYPLNVNCNDNGVNVNQNWNPENAHADVAGSVQGVSKLDKSTSLKGAFVDLLQSLSILPISCSFSSKSKYFFISLGP